MTGKWLVPILLIAFASTAEAGVIVHTDLLRFGEPSVAELSGMLLTLDDQDRDGTRNWGVDHAGGQHSWSVEGHGGFAVGPFAALLDTAFSHELCVTGRLLLRDGRRPPLPELDGLIKPPQRLF